MVVWLTMGLAGGGGGFGKTGGRLTGNAGAGLGPSALATPTVNSHASAAVLRDTRMIPNRTAKYFNKASLPESQEYGKRRVRRPATGFAGVWVGFIEP